MTLKIRNATLVGLCFLLLPACSGATPKDDQTRISYKYAHIDRFGYVAANAFRTTYPEYRLMLGDYAWGREVDEMAIELRIEKNPAPISRLSPAVNLVMRQDKASGRIFYTRPHDRRALPLLDIIPQRSKTPVLMAALRRVGSPVSSKRPNKQAVDDELKRVGATEAVTAVVELSEPLTAKDIRSREYLSLNNAVFSPSVEGGQLVYWDYYTTWFCQGCGGDNTRMTSDFRAWVSSLTPSDDAVLGQFGLSLARLKDVARRFVKCRKLGTRKARSAGRRRASFRPRGSGS
ncbi:hypothetical protein AB0K48_38395, partial [Nonomuraea sp. NPDC055795]